MDSRESQAGKMDKEQFQDERKGRQIRMKGLEIVKELEKMELTLKLAGRLDTNTAPKFQKVIDEELACIAHLKLDMAQIEYVSSAGLRVLFLASKKMSMADGMTITNVNKDVMDVFSITGFDRILAIQ